RRRAGLLGSQVLERPHVGEHQLADRRGTRSLRRVAARGRPPPPDDRARRARGLLGVLLAALWRGLRGARLLVDRGARRRPARAHDTRTVTRQSACAPTHRSASPQLSRCAVSVVVPAPAAVYVAVTDPHPLPGIAERHDASVAGVGPTSTRSTAVSAGA